MENKRYLIPNTITLISLVVGLIGMIVSIEGRIF